MEGERRAFSAREIFQKLHHKVKMPVFFDEVLNNLLPEGIGKSRDPVGNRSGKTVQIVLNHIPDFLSIYAKVVMD